MHIVQNQVSAISFTAYHTQNVQLYLHIGLTSNPQDSRWHFHYITYDICSSTIPVLVKYVNKNYILQLRLLRPLALKDWLTVQK